MASACMRCRKRFVERQLYNVVPSMDRLGLEKRGSQRMRRLSHGWCNFLLDAHASEACQTLRIELHDEDSDSESCLTYD